MQNRITIEEMQAAARQLAKTAQGRAALQRLLAWMEEDGMDLTLLNQRAFLALVGGAWKGHGDVACTAIREALAAPPESGV